MKDFLLIGTRNALFYKDIFPFVQRGEIHLGYTHNHIVRENDFRFLNPEGKIVDIDFFAKWVTNIPRTYTYYYPLTKNYSPEKYPKFDNYNAINIDKTKDIPCDYYDIMGVPVSFIDKYNPEQFEIVGKIDSPVLNGINKYRRLLIKQL